MLGYVSACLSVRESVRLPAYLPAYLPACLLAQERHQLSIWAACGSPGWLVEKGMWNGGNI